MDDRYQTVLLTNFYTNQNRDDKPTENQIQIMIDKEVLCQGTIEDTLVYGCGEGQKVTNKILSKQTKELNGGMFYRYQVEYPSGSQNTIYFLEKEGRILQIEKKPDPSEFEKEFEDIVGSIRFL